MEGMHVVSISLSTGFSVNFYFMSKKRILFILLSIWILCVLASSWYLYRSLRISVHSTVPQDVYTQPSVDPNKDATPPYTPAILYELDTLMNTSTWVKYYDPTVGLYVTAPEILLRGHGVSYGGDIETLEVKEDSTKSVHGGLVLCIVPSSYGRECLLRFYIYDMESVRAYYTYLSEHEEYEMQRNNFPPVYSNTDNRYSTYTHYTDLESLHCGDSFLLTQGDKNISAVYSCTYDFYTIYFYGQNYYMDITGNMDLTPVLQKSMPPPSEPPTSTLVLDLTEGTQMRQTLDFLSLFVSENWQVDPDMDTATWEKYTNEELGISFFHPSDVTITDNSSLNKTGYLSLKGGFSELQVSFILMENEFNFPTIFDEHRKGIFYRNIHNNVEGAPVGIVKFFNQKRYSLWGEWNPTISLCDFFYITEKTSDTVFLTHFYVSKEKTQEQRCVFDENDNDALLKDMFNKSTNSVALNTDLAMLEEIISTIVFLK